MAIICLYLQLCGKQSGIIATDYFHGRRCLTDFRPLLSRPITFLLELRLNWNFLRGTRRILPFGFSVKEAAAIGIVGGADGPTTIFLTAKLAPLLGAVAVAAYSYMALVPVIRLPSSGF